MLYLKGGRVCIYGLAEVLNQQTTKQIGFANQIRKGSPLRKSNKYLSLHINGFAICGLICGWPSFGYYLTSFSLERWKATF
jgi:hypothetical protein